MPGLMVKCQIAGHHLRILPVHRPVVQAEAPGLWVVAYVRAVVAAGIVRVAVSVVWLNRALA